RGYWMYPDNPHSTVSWLTPGRASGFVPAEDIVHIYEPQTNQVHGVPWLAPVMTELRDLKDYELSENIRKKVEACMVGMVIPGEGDTSDPNIGLDEALGNIDKAAITDVNGFPFERMEPGMFGVLHGGKDIK